MKFCEKIYGFFISPGTCLAVKNGDFLSDKNFCEFPRGCCSYASSLLGVWLYDNGINTYDVSGKYEDDHDFQSHEWLETEDGIVIDITRDQFKDSKAPYQCKDRVYVGERDDICELFREYANSQDKKIYLAIDPDTRTELGHEHKLSERYDIIMKYMGEPYKKIKPFSRDLRKPMDSNYVDYTKFYKGKL